MMRIISIISIQNSWLNNYLGAAGRLSLKESGREITGDLVDAASRLVRALFLLVSLKEN
jgi:aspartyl aminopeptidase